uniref:Transmembrane protein 14C n=1 Tax=Panagrolaimus sp. PS1159 TaxID=55785 RepID=A0AC35F4D8_9BILA
MVEWIGLIYAAIVAAGGFIGYLKAGSIPSLAAGLVGGSIAGIGAYTHNFYILLGIAVLLGGFMGFRAINSSKFMPAGLIAVLSLILFVRCIVFFTTKTRTH